MFDATDRTVRSWFAVYRERRRRRRIGVELADDDNGRADDADPATQERIRR